MSSAAIHSARWSNAGGMSEMDQMDSVTNAGDRRHAHRQHSRPQRAAPTAPAGPVVLGNRPCCYCWYRCSSRSAGRWRGVARRGTVSTSTASQPAAVNYRQLMWVIVGVPVMLGVSMLPRRRATLCDLGLSLPRILLFLVPLFGTTVNNAQQWIGSGCSGCSLRVSEALLRALAWVRRCACTTRACRSR